MSVQIFAMNDMEWWIGEGTLEQMRDAYRECCGDDCMEGGEFPRVLDDSELDSLKFYYGDEDEPFDDSKIRTFREQLDIEIAEGVVEPRMFACTEW